MVIANPFRFGWLKMISLISSIFSNEKDLNSVFSIPSLLNLSLKYRSEKECASGNPINTYSLSAPIDGFSIIAISFYQLFR
jgi:hypothetical protein